MQVYYIENALTIRFAINSLELLPACGLETKALFSRAPCRMQRVIRAHRVLLSYCRPIVTYLTSQNAHASIAHGPACGPQGPALQGARRAGGARGCRAPEGTIM